MGAGHRERPGRTVTRRAFTVGSEMSCWLVKSSPAWARRRRWPHNGERTTTIVGRTVPWAIRRRPSLRRRVASAAPLRSAALATRRWIRHPWYSHNSWYRKWGQVKGTATGQARLWHRSPAAFLRQPARALGEFRLAGAAEIL